MKVNSVGLQDLLRQVDSGALRLPDFQRSWVWDDDRIRRLLASVSLSYPIGAVMTVDTGHGGLSFRPRLIAGVPKPAPEAAQALLLDGQQRLTSLYLALKSPLPAPIRGPRGGEDSRHYYADIALCTDPDVDRQDEGIFSVPEDRIVRTDFGKQIALDLSTRPKEARAGKFPLDIILDSDQVEDWMWAYVESDPGREKERKHHWKTFKKAVISPFTSCKIPVLALPQETPKLAVCQVFENVNTGGVQLTVFDLLTAMYAADDFNLRDAWEDRVKEFREHPLLEGLPSTNFLQIVSLLATYERRVQYQRGGPNGDRPPAVSAKRADLLRLNLKDYRQWADRAASGLKRADAFIREEYVFTRKDLPYPSQLVPLAAILAVLGADADSRASRKRLRRWYWSGVLGELYGGSAETRWANDLQDCVRWIRDHGKTPRTVEDAQFQAGRLLTLRTRQSAAYKGIHALTMSSGARDFGAGQRLDMATYLEHKTDIHHIFPRSWCNQSDPQGKGSRGLPRPIPWQHRDSIVNKAAVFSETNRFIGGRAPSRYVPALESHHQTSSREVNRFLRSHCIDPVPLRQDNFRQFFNDRFEALLRLVSRAMEKPVNREQAGDDSPYAEPDVAAWIDREIREGESEWLEFKSTARTDVSTGHKAPFIERAVVKTICAFLNTDGGRLVVGVDDSGKTVGIETDYRFVKGNDRDGWERWLTDMVISAAGAPAASLLELRFAEIGGGTVAHIRVGRSPTPVYVTWKGEKKLFVRVNNTTREMKGPDLPSYLAEHWGPS